MTLADLWITSQGSLEDKKVDQIIKFAGSGRLLDGNDCSKEFTELLAQVPSRYLRKYAEECLSERFDDSGAALQDIVNEVGRRLGFNVTNGRYRGISQQIGHDGLWRTEDGPALVVECKTTSAYQIRLDVVAGYRRRLAAAGEITEDASSILIVVGREDTTDLEAQVRGSRHAWDIRLLSVEALLRLMESKEAADDPEILRQVREVLVPQEFTKLDRIIDLLFSITNEAREAEETEDIEPGEPERLPRFKPVSFHEACIERISGALHRPLVRQSRAVFGSADSAVLVVCAISKEHTNGSNASYWFAFHPHYEAALRTAREPYVAFGCGSAERTLLIPAGDFLPLLDGMNETRKLDRSYRHVSIFRDSERFILHRRVGYDRVDLTKYALPDGGTPTLA